MNTLNTMTVQELTDFIKYLPEIVTKAPIAEIKEEGEGREVPSFNLETGEYFEETVTTTAQAYYQELAYGEGPDCI